MDTIKANNNSRRITKMINDAPFRRDAQFEKSLKTNNITYTINELGDGHSVNVMLSGKHFDKLEDYHTFHYDKEQDITSYFLGTFDTKKSAYKALKSSVSWHIELNGMMDSYMVR